MGLWIPNRLELERSVMTGPFAQVLLLPACCLLPLLSLLAVPQFGHGRCLHLQFKGELLLV